MDILHLVDRLEELLNESKPIPLTRKLLVDESRLLDLIDQMRLAIPEEIKSSQQVLNQKERIIAQAHEEARRTIELAQQQSDKLVEKDLISQRAESYADDLKRKAKEETKQIMLEADEYAINSLEHLELELSKILTQVRNGIHTLKDEIQAEPVSSQNSPTDTEPA